MATGVNFEGGSITGYKIAGWKSAATFSPSIFNGVTISNTNGGNNVYGMDIFGNVFAPVSLSYSNLINNKVGVMAYTIRMNLMKCNTFQNNTSVGVQMESRSLLDMSYINAFNAFEENQIHFLSRFHGILRLDEQDIPVGAGHNGFYNQNGLTNNPLVFWASLEPNVQPFVDYSAPIPSIPSVNNFYETDPMINQTVSGTNYYLDERNTRVLGFTRPTNYANLNDWKDAFYVECLELAPVPMPDPAYKPKDGVFIGTRYSPLNSILLNCGSYSTQPVVSVSQALIDSLYFSVNPDYEVIIDGLSDIVTCTYSTNTALFQSMLFDVYGHLLIAYSKGIAAGEIEVAEDSFSDPSNRLLSTIDILLDNAEDSLHPWANHKFELTFAKVEALRLAAHREDAITLLNGSLGEYTDSLDQVYIYKYICINEAEIAYLDHSVSIDSIFIVYPCFNDSLLFSEPMQQLNNKSFVKENSVKNDIKLFPNPANFQINIQANNDQLIEKIIISDIRGMVIKTIEIKDKLSIYDLNTEKINAGNYIIQVITNQLVYNQAIIIAR